METERFESDPGEMRRLALWLAERAVEVVALEATSDYWRCVFYPLQDAGLNLMLVNPAHLRGIRDVNPTRRTPRSWPGQRPPGW